MAQRIRPLEPGNCLSSMEESRGLWGAGADAGATPYAAKAASGLCGDWDQETDHRRTAPGQEESDQEQHTTPP